jgi:hypothetical protein
MPNLTVPSWSFLKNKSEVGESWGGWDILAASPATTDLRLSPFLFLVSSGPELAHAPHIMKKEQMSGVCNGSSTNRQKSGGAFNHSS